MLIEVTKDEVCEIVANNVLVIMEKHTKAIVVPQVLKIVSVTGEKHGVLNAINCNLSIKVVENFLSF